MFSIALALSHGVRCMFSECLSIMVSSGSVVAGAGALEVAVADALVKHKPNVKGRAQLGVQAFADALLVIPKVSSEHCPIWNFSICLHSV